MSQEGNKKQEPQLYMIERKEKIDEFNNDLKKDILKTTENKIILKNKETNKIFTSRAIQTETLNLSLSSSQSLNSSFVPSSTSEKSSRQSSIDMSKDKFIQK